MKLLKSILLASGASIVLAVGAHGADLPTMKEAPPPEKPNCFATLWTWLDSTPADCPLSAYGFTFYGALDVGGGWASEGSPFNPDHPNGIQDFIANTSHGARWQKVPGGLGSSNAGLKWKEQVAPNWFIVGDVNFGYDPYSRQFHPSFFHIISIV